MGQIGNMGHIQAQYYGKDILGQWDWRWLVIKADGEPDTGGKHNGFAPVQGFDDFAYYNLKKYFDQLYDNTGDK